VDRHSGQGNELSSRTRHDIEILAPVHDAVLIQAPIERIETDVARMQQIMTRASRIVLNPTMGGTYELRTDD